MGGAQASWGKDDSFIEERLKFFLMGVSCSQAGGWHGGPWQEEAEVEPNRRCPRGAERKGVGVAQIGGC